MSNRVDEIIDALEAVECAARELYANMVDVEENLDIEGEELADVGALREALEALDKARSDEGVRVSKERSET